MPHALGERTDPVSGRPRSQPKGVVCGVHTSIRASTSIHRAKIAPAHRIHHMEETMLRKTLFVLGILALAGSFAMAQYVVQPTVEDGPDAYDKGVDAASVDQTVILRVPQATALHLDVTELVFDITSLDGEGWPESTTDFAPYMVCVYGTSEFDVEMGGGFFGQQQVLPLGTYYAVGPNGWPEIEVVNHNGLVTAYPPIQFDGEGELVPGSKNHFVCYRTFILQKFSNGSQWDLSVERTDDAAAEGALQHIYIQDNPCDTFGQGTGFYELGDEPLQLVPEALGTGPTGFRSATNPEVCGFKSWLDDLVVVAVKVNADYAGDNAAVLQYTLATTAWW